MKATTAPTLRVVIATTAFVTPERVAVAPGDLYDADHPIVKARPTLFVPVDDRAIRAGR